MGDARFCCSCLRNSRNPIILYTARVWVQVIFEEGATFLVETSFFPNHRIGV